MRIKLIINFTAGRKKANKYLPEIEKTLSAENDLSVAPTGTIEETTDLVLNSVKEDFNLIIAAGGDGTLNAAINGIMKAKLILTNKPDVSLGFIPLGVSNVFALETGIPLNPIKACQGILRYKTKKADLVKIKEPFTRYFISMLGIGFDAQVVKSVKPQLKRIVGGKLAHILTGIYILMKYNPNKFSILPDTDNARHTGYFAVIGNIKSYGGRFNVTPNANLDDGLLHVCLFKGKRRMDILRYIWGILTRCHLRFSDVAYLKAKNIKIESSDKLCTQIDGEVLEKGPYEFEICPEAISMLLP